MFQTKDKLLIFRIIAILFAVVLIKLFIDYYASLALFSPTVQEKYAEDYFGLFTPLTYNVTIDVTTNKSYTVYETITASNRLLYKNIYLSNLDHDKVLIRNASILNYSHRFSKAGSVLKLRVNDSGYMPKSNYIYDIYYKHLAPHDHIKEYDTLNLILFDSSWRSPHEQLTIRLNMPKPFDRSSLHLTDMYGNVLINPKAYLEVHDNSLIITLDKHVVLNEGLGLSATLPEGYFSKNWIYTIFGEGIWGIILIVPLCASFLIWLLLEKTKKIVPVPMQEPIKYLNPIETGFLYHQHAKPSLIASLIIYWASKDILTIETTSDWTIYVSRLKSLSTEHRHYESLLFSKLFKTDTSIISLQKLKPVFYKMIKESTRSLNTYISSENKGLFKSSKLSTKYIIKCSIGIYLAILLSFYLMSGLTFWSIAMILLNILFVWGIYTFSLNTSIFLDQINDAVKSSLRQSLVMQLIKYFSLLCCFSMLSIIKIYGGFTIPALAEIMCWIGIALLINLYLRCNALTSKGLDYLAQIYGLRQFLLLSLQEELQEIQNQEPHYMIRMLPYAYALGVSDVWFEKMSLLNIEQPSWYTTLWGNEKWTHHLKEICDYIQNELIHPFNKKAPNYFFEETFNGVAKEVFLRILFTRR